MRITKQLKIEKDTNMSDTIIDANTCDRVRTVIEDNLKKPLADMGLKIEMKRFTYESSEIRIPSFKVLTLETACTEVNALRRELRDRANYQWMTELDGDRVVTINARSGPVEVKLWGFKPKAKNKFLAKELANLEDDNSSHYALHPDFVEQRWSR